MASYKIVWKNSATKELKKLPKNIIFKLITSIEELSNNPFPENCSKIIGSKHTFRIRQGDYRILYSVENNQLQIEIIKVGHRKNVYAKT